MKKKILAVVLAGVMAMSMLTACGGSAETAETTETADVETTEDAASDEACSDETFATLQDNYATLTDVYNTVYDAYMSDEIEQNDEIENALAQTADIMNEMGEISQDAITELDAETLNDTMLTLLDVLDAVVDAM
jgi:ABC-type transport system substrate-binding protein